MDWSLMFPGRFLKSAEFLGKDVTLTVTKVALEELPDPKSDGGKKKRGVVTFRETPKELVINKTNALAFKQMFGPETANWHGKRVTLYPAAYTDQMTGEETTAIRVRGSPEIPEDIEFSAKLGLKTAKFRLKRTGPVQVKKPAPAKPASAAPAPVAVPDAQEPAEDFSPEEIAGANADLGVFS